VGSDPALTRELARVRSELRVIGGRVKKLQRERGAENAKRVGKSLNRSQAGAVRRAMKAQREFMKARDLLETRREELEAALAFPEPPTVKVEQTIHAGVQIQIQDARLLIDHTRPGGTFRRDEETGEITAGS